MKGFVLIYRKLTESCFYRKSAYVHLWLHLLIRANHKVQEIVWNGKTVKLLPGQFITGRTELVKETGIPGTTIERSLKLFENEQMIRQQKTNKFRLISILKWGEYQVRGQENGQQEKKKRTSNGHHKDTDNNDNNEIKKDNAPSPEVRVVIDYFIQAVETSKGFKPRVAAKDGALVKANLKGLSLDRIKNQIDFFLSNGKSKNHISLTAALSADTYNLYMAEWNERRLLHDDHTEPPVAEKWWQMRSKERELAY
jgi:hypothetical protein